MKKNKDKAKKAVAERMEFTLKDLGYRFTPLYHAKGHAYPTKTEWIVENEEAFACFSNACLHQVCHARDGVIGEVEDKDYVWWNDDLKGMCSLLYRSKEDGSLSNLLLTLGNNGELFGYFPKPKNPGEIWHGFPVRGERIQKRLLAYWEKRGVLSRLDCRRVKQCKI